MPRVILAAFLAATLGTTGCTDRHGNPDVLATGLLGLGVGLVAGAAIASANEPRHYHASRGHRHHWPASSRAHYSSSYPHYGMARGQRWSYGQPVYRRTHHGW